LVTLCPQVSVCDFALTLLLNAPSSMLAPQHSSTPALHHSSMLAPQHFLLFLSTLSTVWLWLLFRMPSK
jgi:hypothetical protein